MMEALSPYEILKSLELLSWTVCSVGWEREWAAKANLEDYAWTRLEFDVNDADLAAVATLTSANQLDAAEITELLKQLAGSEAERNEITLDKWRLALLLELQAKQFDWDEKVTQLEILGADFGYPTDMRSCYRDVGSEEPPYSDPLDVMDDVISELKKHLTASTKSPPHE